MLSEPQFKFVLFPGNNPGVIKECLQKRGVWRQIEADKLLTANFIWKPLNFSGAVYSQFDEQIRDYSGRKILLNHFEQNHLLTTKTGLVKSLKHYYSHQIAHLNYGVFETIPTTFIVQAQKDTLEEKSLKIRFAEIANGNFSREKVPQKHCQRNVWFVKPQSSNQGRGIELFDNLKEMEQFLNTRPIGSEWVIQKSIEKPLLYNGRKFDIRVWVLITSNFDIHYYNAPYMRTSSSVYDVTELESKIHLTNNYQQKHLEQYSRFQKGNTLPLTILKDYLKERNEAQAEKIFSQITSRMQQLIVDCFYSVKRMFMKNRKKEFELFGFDFLVDQDFRTWLLEVNDNPYLGVPNQFIGELMPLMIDQMMELALDPLFPPIGYKPVEQKRFQLLHRETVESRVIQRRSQSIETARKDYYPLEGKKGIEGYSIPFVLPYIGSMQAPNLMECKIKLKQLTPLQSVKNLLDTYLFMDYDPFICPVSLLLSSSKLKDPECLSSNLKTLKIVTEGRLAGILFEGKIFSTAKALLADQGVHSQLKASLVSGFAVALRGNKQKQLVTEQILPPLLREAQTRPEESLIRQIVSLLIRLGGTVNRAIFVPGETREQETARAQFIESNCLTFLRLLTEKIKSEEYEKFAMNLSNKDEQLQAAQPKLSLDQLVIESWECDLGRKEESAPASHRQKGSTQRRRRSSMREVEQLIPKLRK